MPRTKPTISLPTKGRMGVRHDSRDDNATSIMIGVLPTLELKGRVLVIDDDGEQLTDALRELGLEVTTWYRRVADGHTATPWTDMTKIDAAFMRYPVSRKTFDMLMHAVAPRLSSAGRLFTYGANDEGIKSSGKHLEEVFEVVETLETKRHSRAVSAKQARDVVFKKDLADWKEQVKYDTAQGSVSLVSYPCLFAHGRLDGGTALLLRALPTRLPDTAKVLDYGCGIGIIGHFVQTMYPSIKLDMIDIDAIAIEATKENVPNAKTFTADSMEVVDGNIYDLIVSNPPIHAGKGESFTALIHFVTDAASALTEDGELLFVVQATVPIKDELLKLFEHAAPSMKNEQYTVWRCAKAK